MMPCLHLNHLIKNGALDIHKLLNLNLTIFLGDPESIRKVIYTTNMLESFNSQLRRVTKNKRVFPNDDSVFKTLYFTIQYIVRKWTMPVRDWNDAKAHFLIKFDGRI